MSNKIKNKQLVVTTDFDFLNNKLINLATPSGLTDATNKEYVDTIDKRLTLNSSSGLLKGGVLSINTNNTLFDITSGIGYIIDNHNDPLNPIVKSISWGAITGQSLIYIGSQLATYILINTLGTVFQSPAPPTPSEIRQYIYLGTIVHSNHVNINTINNQPTVAIDIAAQLHDLMLSFGFRSMSGNRIMPSGNTMNIKKEFGVGFKPGANFQISNTQPHVFDLPEQPVVTFRYRNLNSSESGDTTTIDPTSWDNNGVTTIVPSDNNATIQRVFIFPSGLIRIQRGQYVFSTITEAIDKSGTEIFVTEKNISENGLYLGSIIMKKLTSNLSNNINAIFIPASSISSNGATNSITTLQQAYDISFIPQITTNSGGALSIKRGTSLDTDNILNGQNGTGTTTFSVNGNGDISGNTAILRGDISYNSGTSLTTVISQRISVDVSLVSSISSESSLRISADSSLSSIIDNLDYNTNNIDMVALSGVSGQYLATNTTVSQTPKTRVRVEINSIEVTVGNGTKTAFCYFSSDGGTTPKTYSNVTLGDSLYWNGDVAFYQLETTDTISFIYMTF